MPVGTKLVVISESEELGCPDKVAIFDLHNVIHIVFIAYMIYILFESSTLMEKLLLIKMLILVALCLFAYHIFMSESVDGCSIHVVSTEEDTPSELEEEKESLMSTPPSPDMSEEEKTDEFAELLEDPALSPPRKSSSPNA